MKEKYFTTLLIGNGLGMALDSKYFRLQAAIKNVWHNEDDTVLNFKNKNAILKCLPEVNGQRPTIPSSEGQLAMLHQVVSACSLLSKVEKNKTFWLTENGQRFPDVTNYFIGQVAAYFHRYEKNPESYINFVKEMTIFLKSRKAHLATLNYDNLLYQPLIDRGVLRGYDGDLIDGFRGMTYSDSNMERKKGREELGWYLHLHGSPLFYGKNGDVNKMSQTDLTESFISKDVYHRHIVLSHYKTKTEIISGSSLLASYWEYFERALGESCDLLVFGYGGQDRHVNKKISGWIEQRRKLKMSIKILVVEWNNPAREFSEEKEKWLNRFDPMGILKPGEFKLKRYENILDFDWGLLGD
ncbi:SIR2 family protein [Bdellovibrio sp. HCB-110]|uniref:SIR2 family protein n=1 Tax=Bdellovibrio sp. HCB-110 TaxID=3391182 RepID=UPI0039B61DBA